MEVIIQPNRELASEIAARLIARQVREKPASVLGLATGKTPLVLYRMLVQMHRDGKLDLSKVTVFNLDEYVGIDRDHPASYCRFMEEHFFSHVNIPPEQRFIPDGMAKNIAAHCKDYENSIRGAGGIDLQLLGLGTDGHIGFNEPGSSLASRTRIKSLTEQTRRDNRRAFSSGEKVPRHVITMGLGTIMESRACVLLAFGKKKAPAVRRSVEGPVTASVPGSILQFHPRAKIILDDGAASLLRRAEYYREVYKNKPAWQADL
jgi:glucosamine-6-phosphate deaminase